MNPYKNNPARRDNIVEQELMAAIRGFCNKTMRRANQTKPHIAYINGYWRVSPWKPGTGSLYYNAHGWVNYRNYRLGCERDRAQESGVAKGGYLDQIAKLQHRPHRIECDDPIKESTKLNAQREIDKQLKHALNYGVGPAGLLRIIENNTLVETNQSKQEEE